MTRLDEGRSHFAGDGAHHKPRRTYFIPGMTSFGGALNAGCFEDEAGQAWASPDERQPD